MVICVFIESLVSIVVKESISFFILIMVCDKFIMFYELMDRFVDVFLNLRL